MISQVKWYVLKVFAKYVEIERYVYDNDICNTFVLAINM